MPWERDWSKGGTIPEDFVPIEQSSTYSNSLEHSSRCETRRQRLEPCAQRDVQKVGQEGDEDVRLDAEIPSSTDS
jgi:hypothetical protein